MLTENLPYLINTKFHFSLNQYNTDTDGFYSSVVTSVRGVSNGELGD